MEREGENEHTSKYRRYIAQDKWAATNLKDHKYAQQCSHVKHKEWQWCFIAAQKKCARNSVG